MRFQHCTIHQGSHLSHLFSLNLGPWSKKYFKNFLESKVLALEALAKPQISPGAIHIQPLRG